MTSKRIDSTYIIFGFLALFLVGSFWYLMDTDDASKIKYKNMDKVEKLILLNQKIDHFLRKKLQHENFDIISKNVSDFKITFTCLNNSSSELMKNSDTVAEIELLRKKFKNKVKVVEEFKSHIGLFISSVHYMMSLNNGIQKRYYFSPILTKTQKISLSFIQSLFEGGDLYKIKLIIQELKNIYKSNNLTDPQVQNFINHSQYALEYVDKLNELIKQNEEIDLEKSLYSLSTVMQNNFDDSAQVEEFLQHFLFIVDTLIFIILIVTYRYMRLNEQGLTRFKNAVENSDNSIVITDKNHKITYINDAFVRITGYKKEEVIGKSPSILKSDKMSEGFYEHLNNKLDNREKWEGEFINRRKDGSLYHEAASIVPLIGHNKEVDGYLAIKLDITNYIRQQEELLQKTKRLNEAQKIAQIGHWELDIKSGIINISYEVIRIFGIDKSKEFMPFKDFVKFIHEEEKARVMLAFRKHIDSEFNGNLEFRILTQDGKEKHLQAHLHKKFDNKGKLIALTGTVQDITQLVLAREEINFIAYHDHLTRLDNRVAFENKLEHAIFLAKRKKSIIAVMFIDLDRFKVVNDTLGHQVGDKLLKVVSERLVSVKRESDTLARLGGDEFGVFIETVNDFKEVAIVAEKILKEVQKPINFDNYTLDVTASIGISMYPENGMDTATLLKNADSAMYLAKDKGKNNYQYFTEELSQKVYRRHNIEQAMRDALKNNEFELAYQPQYDLTKKKTIGFEALLRWNSESLGPISPVEFIPVAEESGMIIAIGEWVLKEACLTFKKLEKMGIAPNIFSINVSSIQFKQDDLIEKFTKIIDELGVKPTSIEIEITESYLVETSEQNLTVLDDLRKIGFRISVDDFGTGYSSMSYLKNLPLDTIKIDKSFVDDIPNNKNDVAVTKAIITLSKSLGYVIIAEGIENSEQEYFLQQHGCEIGQGYFFSKPLGLDKLIDFLS